MKPVPPEIDQRAAALFEEADGLYARAAEQRVATTRNSSLIETLYIAFLVWHLQGKTWAWWELALFLAGLLVLRSMLASSPEALYRRAEAKRAEALRLLGRES